MKLFVPLMLLSSFAYAQQGRHELPIDTISIGGKEQDVKMTQLEGYDDLLKTLTQVRDSIAEISPEQERDARAESDESESDHEVSDNDYRIRLEELIQEMKQKENDENLMKEGYMLLNEIRRTTRKSD